MSKMASILSGCAVASMFSFQAQALPALPVPAAVAAVEVTLVKGGCGRGFHRDIDGDCLANGYLEPLGLPYVAPPAVGLPYVALPDVRLPYVAGPAVRLPYVAPPTVGLGYVAPPDVRLPYVAGPVVRLPYIAPPVVRLPYVGM
jgi:hypothetical protein